MALASHARTLLVCCLLVGCTQTSSHRGFERAISTARPGETATPIQGIVSKWDYVGVLTGTCGQRNVMHRVKTTSDDVTQVIDGCTQVTTTIPPKDLLFSTDPKLLAYILPSQVSAPGNKPRPVGPVSVDNYYMSQEEFDNGTFAQAWGIHRSQSPGDPDYDFEVLNTNDNLAVRIVSVPDVAAFNLLPSPVPVTDSITLAGTEFYSSSTSPQLTISPAYRTWRIKGDSIDVNGYFQYWLDASLARK